MNKIKVQNSEGELLTYDQVCAKSNLGKATVMRLARESGSLIKIGKSARIDQKKFFDYVLKEYRAPEDI